MVKSCLKGAHSMTKTERTIYALVGPTRYNTLPFSTAIDLAIDLLFVQHRAMDDIRVTNDIYVPVAREVKKSVSAASRQIVRLCNLCWDTMLAEGVVEEYIGKPIRDLHAPSEIVFYMAFLIHFDKPFFEVVQDKPELLF